MVSSFYKFCVFFLLCLQTFFCKLINLISRDCYSGFQIPSFRHSVILGLARTTATINLIRISAQKSAKCACKRALCWHQELFGTLLGPFGEKLERFENISQPSLTFDEEANPR